MKKLRFVPLIACALAASADGNAFGGQVSVTTSAQSITTLLSLSAGVTAKQLTIRVDPASANTIYCGGSTVTNVPANARIAIAAANTPAYTWGGGSTSGVVATSDIFCVATTGTTTAFIDGLQ